MKTVKLILLAFIVIFMHNSIDAQIIIGQIHNRFVGYGLSELYIYLTLQENGRLISQTNPCMQVPVDDVGEFVFTMPEVTTGGYAVRNFLTNVMGIYDNVHVSNESVLTMMDIRANAQGTLSEYFGPCDDSTRGSQIGFYVHASKPVTISGKALNLAFKAGWNLMIIDNKTETIRVTSNLNSGWNWGTD